MNWLYVCALLQAVLGAGILIHFFAEQKARRLVAKRLAGGPVNATGRLLQDFGSSKLGQKGLTFDSETKQLLYQLGWRKNKQKSLFMIMQFGLPLLLLCVVQVYVLLRSEGGVSPFVLMFFALGLGYLVPKRMLVKAVRKRQQQLADEVASALPMLRILFEVGMVVEQALRILSVEGRQILPVLSVELQQLLQRVDAGLDLRSELRRSADLMNVEELTDCFMVLEQLAQQGSGAMSSLLSMKERLDERRLVQLQEAISKMSAKMSIVMVSFLFPALLIVLAGPGFIAIIQAIGDIG